MLALLIAVICVVALLTVLVAGLLRSHADILRALHSLGAGVGDPAQPPERDGAETTDGAETADGIETAEGDHGGHSTPARLRVTTSAGAGAQSERMVTYGALLPADRSSAAQDLVGVAPSGEAVAVAVSAPGRLTLLAFLSSGCTSCRRFWQDLQDPAAVGLPPAVRVVAVAKGPDRELPGEIAELAGERLTTVMSSDAWTDYEVPGSPFFALVDGDAGRRIGEGVGVTPPQLADLVRRALADRQALGAERAHGPGLDGPEREADNDRQLIEAGVLPGDESLYPRTLADVFGGRNAEARGN
jgi:hypothetical protein